MRRCVLKRTKLNMRNNANAVHEAVHEALQQEAIETAKEMLKDRNSVEKIARYVKRLSIKEVEELKEEFYPSQNP